MCKNVLYGACWLAMLLLVNHSGVAQNLALNKPAKATSFQGGFPANLAFDGNSTGTRWGSEYDTKLTTILPDSNSVYVDLQGMATITRIDLTWETALGKDFKLEVSDNATTWRSIVRVTGNGSKTNTFTTFSGPATGRYVRMHGLKRGTVYGYSLWEFQVFGTLTPLPLPVTLSAFSATAQQENAAVALRWTTATEQQNAGFRVQRSADGVQFTDLAFVPGAGNSQRPLNYSYVDTQPLSATTTAYYRLAQLDLSGAVTYSPVRAVSAAASPPAGVFPNPATAQTTLEWQSASAGPGRWYLTNALGQVVHTAALTERLGYNALLINMAPYAAGSYVLTREGAGQPRHHTRLQKVD